MHSFKAPICLTLKKIREQTGFSIEELSKYVGLEPEWIKGFESGSREIWPDARQKISKFFGIRQPDLFPEIKDALEISPYPRCMTLRRIRTSRGLTQTALGWEAKLSGYYISRFENGIAIPWPGAIAKLCLVLEETPESLFPELPTKIVK
ncbi:MAG TPA: helix-turn-helix transcriptional regulator [Vampirovibrionales bacterium]